MGRFRLSIADNQKTELENQKKVARRINNYLTSRNIMSLFRNYTTLLTKFPFEKINRTFTREF